MSDPVRSRLAVPASNESMIAKALRSDADAVFLDLEDSVAEGMKPEAREHVVRAFADLDWGRKARAYRINPVTSGHCYRDLVDVLEAVGDRVEWIVVPKVESPADVEFVATLVSQIETGTGIEPRVQLDVQIETARGLTACEEIARGSPRIGAITFGPGDFAASTGMPMAVIGAPDVWDARYPGHRWHYAMQRLVVAGRATGVQVIDGPFADFRDPEGLRRSSGIARALGFDGKWCIHPAQIAIVNEVFGPAADEVAWARLVVAENERVRASGRGSFALDGKMVDAASIRMAERTLAMVREDGSG